MSARNTLRRLDTPIRRSAKHVVSLFDPNVDYEEAKQEASALVLAYAGIIPSFRGRGHYDTLKDTEAEAENEKNLRGIIQGRLQRDLRRYYSRIISQEASTIPAEWVSDNDLPQDAGFQDDLINRLDFQDPFFEKYPYLAQRFLDDETEKQISEESGTPLRTVERRVAEEKARATDDPMVTAKRTHQPEEKPEGEIVRCRGLAEEWRDGEIVVVDCGALFKYGTGLDMCHSLKCWQLASDRRIAEERKQWNPEFGGYSMRHEHDDPRTESPELYDYKGWRVLIPAQSEMELAA